MCTVFSSLLLASLQIGWREDRKKKIGENSKKKNSSDVKCTDSENFGHSKQTIWQRLYVFVCRIWCALKCAPYFFFPFHLYVVPLSLFCSAPDVCRFISIFERRRIVTLSLKDDFERRTYRKQLLVVACLFVYYLQNIFGFFLFYFQQNRWPSYWNVCVCVHLLLLHVAKIHLNLYQSLKIITLEVFGFSVWHCTRETDNKQIESI